MFNVFHIKLLFYCYWPLLVEKLFITIIYFFYLFSVFWPIKVIIILFNDYSVIVKCLILFWLMFCKAYILSMILLFCFERHLNVMLLEKYMFVLHTRHTQRKINGSTSFAIDNMYYANFRIQEQVSVPWCGEIQNQRLEVLENTLNLHSNSTLCSRSVVSQSLFKKRIGEWLTLTYTPFHSF